MKKKVIYEFIKHKLQTDRIWQTRALVAIFNRQTEAEQQAETTILHNNVGFTGCDGHILSSFAKQWLSRNWLSEKQLYYLERKMPRYWHQIYEISNKQKLENQTSEWLKSFSEQTELNFGGNNV